MVVEWLKLHITECVVFVVLSLLLLVALHSFYRGMIEIYASVKDESVDANTAALQVILIVFLIGLAMVVGLPVVCDLIRKLV